VAADRVSHSGRVTNVLLDEGEIALPSEPFEIIFGAAAGQIVEDHDLVRELHEALDDVAADEASPASHDPLHRGPPSVVVIFGMLAYRVDAADGVDLPDRPNGNVATYYTG
jgi:hypothetical protein